MSDSAAADRHEQHAFLEREREARHQRVLRALRTASDDDSFRDIAARVGVQAEYVSKCAKEIAAELAELRARPEPPKPAAEAPVALTRVHCIVAGEEIGARDCIARQCSDKCFCPKASFAINAIAPTVLPGTRLEDELGRCRAVARSVLLKPVGERHLGPALVALRGGKPAPRPLIAGELPAPPKREESGPLITARRDTSGGGEVKAERRNPPAPAAKASPPPIPEQQQQPAPPAKEKSMPPPSPIKNVPDAEFRKAFEEEGGSMVAIARRFGAARKTVRKRIVDLGLPIADPHSHRPSGSGATTPPKVAKPPRIAPVAATHSDPGAEHDEFERMRRIIDDYQALSREGRLYVSGRLTSLS